MDENATALSLAASDSARWVSAFDQVWQTLKSMYYSTGESSAAWDALREKYRREMARVDDAASAEAIIDRMIAEQPLMKPAVESPRAVVASGHPLASAAGAAILERGGNVVDAGIAVSFALGVVEPDASSIGGDGQAILFLKGMSEPVVIEYKDMSPSRATPDNPKIFTPTGARTASDGPTVAAIPGVVAGLDLLYQKYGSKKVQWADLIAPAVKIADEGFILDEALPTTVEEGRASFAKYPESARLFIPNGKPIAPGDRFVNKDYAETLRTIAKEGGQSFYRGSIAKRIAADMAASGGIISEEDLAQYRAMERKPLAGRYRNHLVYSVPAPVSTGLQIIETLQILDHYQAAPGATLAKDPDFLHHAIDAWRVRDGGARIADPERWPVDLGNHLDPAHALERFKLIDPKKVYVAQGGGRGGGLPCSGQSGLPGQRTRRARLGWTRRPRPDRHDRVRRRGRRRQHDRLYPDTLDVGRELLRVEGPRIPLQRSLPRRPRRNGIRVDGAPDANVDDERADAGVCTGPGRHAVGHPGLHASPRGWMRRERVDSRLRLQHHPERRGQPACRPSRPSKRPAC